ncbi:MAG TPA: hypothetical protein VMU09_06580, partial [Acidimicrobiales bacterium]|nr:hypothetical protein [Acidimicrobiales bacterium]
MSVTSRWRLVLARVVGAAVAVGSVLGVGLVSLPAASAGATAAPGSGFWLVGQDGGVFAFGSAAYLGGPNTVPPDVCMAPVATAPIDCAGIAATPDGHGYWVFSTEPPFETGGWVGMVAGFGSAGPPRAPDPLGGLNAGIVGSATGPDDAAVWLAGADGGVFALGDALFYGSAVGLRLNAPVVAMASTPDGKGYWLVAADGGVFAFGDAAFYGSASGLHLVQPVVGVARTHDGRGYWLVSRDGGVFAFGDAAFAGSSAGAEGVEPPVVGIAADPSGSGYWTVTNDGVVLSFGGAPLLGDLHDVPLAAAIVGIAAVPLG